MTSWHPTSHLRWHAVEKRTDALLLVNTDAGPMVLQQEWKRYLPAPPPGEAMHFETEWRDVEVE